MAKNHIFSLCNQLHLNYSSWIAWNRAPECSKDSFWSQILVILWRQAEIIQNMLFSAILVTEYAFGRVCTLTGTRTAKLKP
jgi:hypothetical protein